MRKPVSSVFQNRPLAPSPFRPLSFPALPCRKFFLPFPPKFKCPKNRREGQEEFAAREGGEAERAKRRGGERAILLSRCCNVDHRRQLPNGAYRDSPGRPLAPSNIDVSCRMLAPRRLRLPLDIAAHARPLLRIHRLTPQHRVDRRAQNGARHRHVVPRTRAIQLSVIDQPLSDVGAAAPTAAALYCSPRSAAAADSPAHPPTPRRSPRADRRPSPARRSADARYPTVRDRPAAAGRQTGRNPACTQHRRPWPLPASRRSRSDNSSRVPPPSPSGARAHRRDIARRSSAKWPPSPAPRRRNLFQAAPVRA